MTADGDGPILIRGAGAVGGTIGACLARAGHPVVLVDVVAEHVAAIAERGLTLEGALGGFAQRLPAATPDQLRGTYRRSASLDRANLDALAEAAP